MPFSGRRSRRPSTAEKGANAVGLFPGLRRPPLSGSALVRPARILCQSWRPESAKRHLFWSAEDIIKSLEMRAFSPIRLGSAAAQRLSSLPVWRGRRPNSSPPSTARRLWPAFCASPAGRHLQRVQRAGADVGVSEEDIFFSNLRALNR